MAREITLFGQKYQVSEGFENYAKVRREFETLSEKYAESYGKQLEHECKDAEAVINKAYNIANTYFDKAADIILDRLVQNGIYTVKGQDIRNFAESYGALTAFDKAFSSIEDSYYGIVQNAEEAKRQRELRKESRGRFVGGGFGFQGAVQGAVKAGMLNQATGIGHSIINSIGNARTEREKRERLDTLYFMSKNTLRNAFKTSISNYYVVMINVSIDYKLSTFDWPSEKDEEQAKAILENLKADRIPKDKINDVLYRLFTLDPFNFNTYRSILEKFGDSKAELQKFGEAHGLNIHSIKVDIIDKGCYSDVMALCAAYNQEKDPIKFEKELISIQSKIDKVKKVLGLTAGPECDKLIEQELQHLVAIYKTVDGVVFNSIEEASLAKKDLKTFYKCVGNYGIESSKILREEIGKIKFETDIVTANLEKRLQDIKLLTYDKELGKRIYNILKDYRTKAFVLEVSNNFSKNASIARKMANIPNNEKIILIFKNEKNYEGDDLTWWVLTNDKLYTFDSKNDKIEGKKVVPFLDIESIHADKEGNLITHLKGGEKGTTILKLSVKCEQYNEQEKLTKAMEDVCFLIAPLPKDRFKSEETGKKKDTVELNVKKLADDFSWKPILSKYKDIKQNACINDNSSEFETLLNGAKKYWDCSFGYEVVYFVMMDDPSGDSIVLTSERCYIHGKVKPSKERYVFPITKIGTFRHDNRDKYLMSFDVDYFSENYFNCSDGGDCYNNVEFNIHIPEEAGERICQLLTSMEEKICRPMLEKKEKIQYFHEAIEEADDIFKISEVIKKIKNDKIVDADDKKDILSKAQGKVDKYQSADAKKHALEQLLSTIQSDDLSSINAASNQILTNGLLNENDKKSAITRLIDLQLEIGSKLYETELKNFFKVGRTDILLQDQPVYIKDRSPKISKKMCDFFINVRLELEEDEIPLLLFIKNNKFSGMDAQFKSGECLISNKRLLIYSGRKYEAYTLDDLVIKAEDIQLGVIRDRKGNKISICFPYIEVATITDKSLQEKLHPVLWYPEKRSEHEAVAKELETFVDGVYKKTTEIKKMNEVLSKLPADGSAIKALSKEGLEKEYKEWKQYVQYGSKVTDYLALVEEAIKEIYKKEVGALCTGLSDMSIDELTELKRKLNKEFSNAQFAHFIAKEKKAVETELQKKTDEAAREEIVEKSAKIDSFTRTELEDEYIKWSSYSGDVAEVKNFLQAIEEALREVYKKEAAEMCSDLENLSVKETKDLLKKLNNTFLNKDYISEEIDFVKTAIFKKQEQEIRGWMPDNLDVLSEKELNSFITKFNSQNYDRSLYSKYALPLVEKRNMLVAEKAEGMASYARSKATTAVKDSCLKIVSKENMLNNLKQQTGAEADTLVCSFGTEPNTCQIYTKKFVNIETCLKWETISAFEVKKKIFGSTLLYRCQNGTSGEIDIQVTASLLLPIAELLNGILHWTKYGAEIQEKSDKNAQVAEKDLKQEKVPVNTADLRSVIAGFVDENYAVPQVETSGTGKGPEESKGEETKKDVPEKKASVRNLDAEYNELKPIVEPILSIITEHAQSVKAEYNDYRIMNWDGDMDVIEGEQAPIFLFLMNIDCSPRMLGEKFIKQDAKRVTGLNTDFLYILTLDKFILYVKGVKYQWKYSDIVMLSIRNGFLSTSLLVNEANGNTKKIEINAFFMNHIYALNEIINKMKHLKDGSVEPAPPSVKEVTSEKQQMEGSAQTAETDLKQGKVTTEPETVATEEKSVPVNTDDLRSFIIGLMVEYRAEPQAQTLGISCLGDANYDSWIQKLVKNLPFAQAGERILFIFDTTLFSNLKKGFVITNMNVYDIKSKTHCPLNKVVKITAMPLKMRFEFANGIYFDVTCDVIDEQKKNVLAKYLIRMINAVAE